MTVIVGRAGEHNVLMCDSITTTAVRARLPGELSKTLVNEPLMIANVSFCPKNPSRARSRNQ